MSKLPSQNSFIACLFQKPYVWFFLGLFAIAWAVYVNIFPKGVIVLGGDVLQPMNMHENWLLFHYEYLGRTSLFYGIFYFLDTFGISETGQLSWYLAIFLFGAYGSFYGFSRLMLPKTTGMFSMLASLFYATNIYTLYVFTATWGFTHYQILYVFIPILTGLYIRMLTERDRSYYFRLFLLAVALASTGFGNPAFALGLGIYFILLTIALFTLGVVSFETSTARKFLGAILGALLLNAYWFLPLLPQVQTGVAEVNASTDIVLSDSIRKTSAAFFDTVRLLQTHESELYYPQNFPYPSFEWLKNIVSVVAFMPFFFVLATLYRVREANSRRIQVLFLGLFTVMAALVAHVRFPFDGINAILFQLSGMNVLRGWDKLAIFMPFLLSASLLYSLVLWQNTRYSRFVGITCFAVIIFVSLPFYAGGIQTKMSYILAGSAKKDFQTADYSALVKIPQPYYDVENVFAKDKYENKISRLPFSPGSSVGRINLPEWGVNGPSPENSLYSKKYIEPNGAYFSDWVFARDFEDSRYDPQWIIDWYGLVGVRYVIWHKDAKPDAVEVTDRALRYLKTRGSIVTLKDNKWFTLYRIDDAYVFPYTYNVFGDTSLYPMVDGLSEKINAMRKLAVPLMYERKNLREIIIPINDTMVGRPGDTTVFLNEKYDPLWKAEFVAADGKRTVLVRDEAVRYANAWKRGNITRSGSIDIYYTPIRLLHIGTVVSMTVLVAVCVGFIASRKKA